MTRFLLAAAALVTATLGAAAAAAGQAVTHVPDLSQRFFIAFSDVCVPLALGRLSLAEPSEASANLRLAPLGPVPDFLATNFEPTRWFSPEDHPGTLFLAQRPGRQVCILVLANTSQTTEIQAHFAAALAAAGFTPVAPSGTPVDAGYNEAMWAAQAPGGWLIVLLQGPRQTVNDGRGDQAVVRVMLTSNEEFEAAQQR